MLETVVKQGLLDVESIVSISKEIMSYQSYIEEIGRETYLVVITLTKSDRARQKVILYLKEQV